MKTILKTPFISKILTGYAGAIFLIGFCVRLVYFFFKGERISYDTGEYVKLADNLYNFGAYSLNDFPNFIPSLRRPPFYPFFLSFFQWIEGGKLPFQFVVQIQCVLDALTAAGIFLLARKIVSPRIAVVAALFYAFHPGAIASTNQILTETLFTFLLVAGVLALLNAFEKQRIGFFILSGFLLGLAVLTRPFAIIFPFLFLIATLLKREPVKKYRLITVTAVAFLLTLAPWLYRCYSVSGQFVFVQGVTAFQYYTPTRVDLDQSNDENLWREFFDPNTEDEYFRKLAWAETPADFIEAEKIGRRKALENIKNHPKEYLISRIKTYPHLFLTSFDNFTGFNKSFGALFSEGNVFILLGKLSLLLVFSFLPFVFGLIGLLRISQNLTALFCALVWTSTLLIHLPMWIEYRFWVPAIPFQIVSATVFLAILRDRFFPLKSAES